MAPPLCEDTAAAPDELFTPKLLAGVAGAIADARSLDAFLAACRATWALRGDPALRGAWAARGWRPFTKVRTPWWAGPAGTCGRSV